MPRWTALVAIVLLTACGDHVGQTLAGRSIAPLAASGPAMSATPIPWISAPPSYPVPPIPTAAPVPVGPSRCDPTQLRLDGGIHQVTMGVTYGYVVLIHDGPSCLLTGDVTLRFFDDLGLMRMSTTSAPASVSQQYPGWALAGSARVYWQGRWCDAAHSIVAVELTYDGVTHRAPLDPWTRVWSCDPASVGMAGSSAASVWPIAPAPTSPPPPVVAVFAPTLSAPARVRAGDTMQFIVTLTNASPDVVTFEPCPNYTEWLNAALPTPPSLPPRKPGVVEPPRYTLLAREGHALNCAALTSLAPAASVTLAMELTIPADTTGETLLRWQLSEVNARIASAPVVVEPR